MTMRKKDYEAIAQAIRRFYDDDTCPPIHTASGAVEYVANNIAECCATQDPTFKRERFLADCGVSHD